MNVDEFEKIVESWRSYILVDALAGYSLEIDEDVPKEFAAIALYLDTTTVRAAGETTEYYDGYRKAATDVLNLLGLQMVQDDEMRIIHLDGVVYIGDKPTDGAIETIATLRRLGKTVIFLTNDPRGSCREYAEKLNRMGIPASPQDIITSGMAIAHYLKKHYKLDHKKAYVVGSKALKEEIEQIGLILTQGEEAKRSDFVIVGGHQGFNYEEMKLATLAIRNGAHFFATNRDPVFPTPEGLVPATGAILA